MNKNTGLLCEGGGTKGAYTAGVLQCFLDEHIDFPYVVGISAGAVNLMPYVSKQRDRFRITGVDSASQKGAMGIRAFLKEGSLFGIKETYNYIEDHCKLDFKTFKSNPCKIDIGLYNLDTGKIEYFDKTYHQEDDILIKAACALALLCPPYKFNNGTYMDAGLIDMIPIEQSIRVGNTKHIFISTKEINYVRKEAPKWQLLLAKLLYRKYPHVKEDLAKRHLSYKTQWSKVQELEASNSALVLRPSRDMGITRYTQDKDKLNAWFDLGYQDTLDRMEQIKEFIK
ncbi:MAG: patatin family protein [Erysipelotrichaceae bacterium]